MTRGCWLPVLPYAFHPHLCFPSLPPLPILASTSLTAPATLQSWALCWLPDTRGAARPSLGILQPVFLQTDPHGIFGPSSPCRAPEGAPLAFRAVDRHTAHSRTDSQALPRGQAGIQPHPDVFSLELKPAPLRDALPRSQGADRTGERKGESQAFHHRRGSNVAPYLCPSFTAGKAEAQRCWVSPSPDPHPCCSRALIRALTGMETIQPRAVPRGSNLFPFPSQPQARTASPALPARPLAVGKAEPALTKCHRKPMGQVLFRKLWENMFMPRIRAAPLAVATE